MNKNKFILIFMIVSFLAGCAPSPAKRYSQEISPILESLSQWQTDYNNLAEKLIIYAVFFDFYNISASYTGYAGEDWPKYFNENYPHLMELIQPAAMITENGQQILNVIGVITPPEELTVAHNQIVVCIKTRISFTEILSASLTSLQPIDFSRFDFSIFPKFNV
jgi:hypothetical protein